MMVLVDTPVWSLALRRKLTDLNANERRLTKPLAELIREGRARLAGPVRQELLSGIREEERFNRLRDYLRVFDEQALEAQDYEEAALMHNQCRARGIAGLPIDFLLCAVAGQRRWQIFATDHDFPRYARVVSIALFTPA